MTHQSDRGGDPGSPLVTDSLLEMVGAAIARNDVESAVRLYEQSGGVVGQALVAQLDSMGEAHKAALAQMFTSARDFAYAAVVCERLARHADAARLYEQAGEYVLAARCYQSAGDVVAAGAAFERAGKTQVALDLYEHAGAHEAAAHCLVRSNRFFDAARLYARLGNARAEVDMLYRVPMDSPQRPAAALRLAELLEQFEHPDQAIQVLGDTLAQSPAAQTDVALQARLVALCESRGTPELVAHVKEYIAQVTSGAGRPPQPLSQSAEMRAVMDHHNLRAAKALLHGGSARPTPIEISGGAVHEPDPFEGLLQRRSAGTDDAEAYRYLKQIPLFAELSLPDMQALYHLCMHVSFPANTLVIEQGVPGAGLMVILQGAVNVMRVHGGTMTLLATLGPGEALGEVSIFDAAPTSARVVATTAMNALFMPREAFAAYVSTRDAAALRIYRVLNRTLAERLRIANLR